MSATSSASALRASANTTEAGWSRTVVHPALTAVANATTRPADPSSPRVSDSVPSRRVRISRSKSRFSGWARSARVICCPVRSITLRPL